MSRYRWIPALLLLILFAMRSTACNAQDPTIGVAASVKPNAESVAGETSQTLSPGSQLRANEKVRTGNRGQADLVFIDNTNLTVGPTSEVLLDKFVYDPTGSSGKVVLNATRGTFRFITGKQDHRVYAVSTPYGTLGVRGTVVRVDVLDPAEKKRRRDKCDVRVTVDQGEGEFTLRDPQTGEQKHYRVRAGQSICVKDGAVTYSTAAAPPPPSPPGGITPPCVPISPATTCQ
jgi:ferric-dicitrate binding protein FerR (iron transport regulator)